MFKPIQVCLVLPSNHFLYYWSPYSLHSHLHDRWPSHCSNVLVCPKQASFSFIFELISIMQPLPCLLPSEKIVFGIYFVVRMFSKLFFLALDTMRLHTHIYETVWNDTLSYVMEHVLKFILPECCSWHQKALLSLTSGDLTHLLLEQITETIYTTHFHHEHNHQAKHLPLTAHSTSCCMIIA